MQREITEATPLLDGQGVLTQAGWSRTPVWHYQRQAIIAPWYRIKEWDYFCLLSDEEQLGLSVTISDLSFASLLAVCWIDLKSGTTHQKDLLIPFTRGRLGLDENSESSRVSLNKNGWKLDYRATQKNQWQLDLQLDNFQGNESLQANLTFTLPDADDTLNIASNWQENRRAFYYNRKINGLVISGQAIKGSQAVRFSSPDTLATLDWGRGVWTYRNRWYWASANGMVGGKRFGLNLGYGFSDRSNGSENAVSVDGQLYKLEDIHFDFNEQDYLQSWQAKSSDGLLELEFHPIVDRESHTNFLVIRSDQHQVFGYFKGSFQVPDGSRIEFDRLLGFAEDVYNRF